MHFDTDLSTNKRPKILFGDDLRQKLEEKSKKLVNTVEDADEFYGLPIKAKQIFEEQRNIKTLYEWQDKCLRQSYVENGTNLLISLPTGGGKTLVAEILILKQVLCKARDVLFVLPFVSIVQEKIKALLPFGLELDFLVEEYAANKGKIPPLKRKNKRSVYIATIEKAQILINSLIEEHRLDDLGLVIVDELHMIGDGTNRGACLEQIISKVLYVCTNTQIIGISATLGNIEDLKRFMKAEIFSCEFRPVALTEYVKLKQNLYQINVNNSRSSSDLIRFCRNIPDSANASDPDSLAALVEEIIPNDSCLIFCPSKKNCENLASLLARILPKSLLECRLQERKFLLKALWNECDKNLCPILRHCVPFGIAYHHSGLTADERKLIQDAFLEGALSVVCCTSTLAAGVNLPAKRVILRSPLVGNQFMSKQQYKQMSGRAGRAGLDSSGESILLIQSNQKQQVLDLLSSSYDKCLSSFLYNDGNGMRNLFLNIVGLELVASKSTLIRFLQHTLFWIQLNDQELNLLSEKVENALRYLTQRNLLKLEKDPDVENDIKICITKLGKAVYKGSIDIDHASAVYDDLKAAVQCLVLSTRLHLLFCVIPYDHVSEIIPDWSIFYEEFCKTSQEERKLFEVLGVSETFLMKKSIGHASVKSTCSQDVTNRLYLSLALKCLWQQETVWKVAERFSLSRGFVQNLLQACASFASCLSRFCEQLDEFWALQCLLPDFTKQLAYCCSMELIPLMEIQGVKHGRARQLYNAGYRSVQDLANVDSELLVSQIEHISRRQARQLVACAKMLFHEKVELLKEQAEELLSNNASVNISVNDVVAALRDFD